MKTDRPLCKDTIHCLAQYSNEESAQHNQRYCHPCRFSELCRMKNDVSHCKQFIHIETRAIPCRYGRECRDIIDPIHRYKYRHHNLPDLLYPCRRSQCDNKSFEHRKRYSHREKIHIKLPSKNPSNVFFWIIFLTLLYWYRKETRKNTSQTYRITSYTD